MKYLLIMSVALALNAFEANAATAPATKPSANELSKLDPKKREVLKQMILMKGELAQTDCRASDPSTCQGPQINKSDLSVKNEAPQLEAEPTLADERSKTIRSLSEACKAQDAGACKRLAVISKEMNKTRTSMQLYKMACDYGDAVVCRELSASLLKAGKTDLSQLYLQKACLKGDATACAKEAL